MNHLAELLKSWQPNITNNIHYYSRELLGIPYSVYQGPIKHNIQDLTVQEFNYDFNSLDCVTYVETVLALSFMSQPTQANFESSLKKIRYKNNVATFFNRNHDFTCSMWLPNNSDILIDTTPNNLTAKTTLDKINWLRDNPETPFAKDMSDLELENLLEIYNIMPREKSTIKYINLSKIIEFPEISVISIVRKNWQNLNVSHMGLALKEQNMILFRHATSIDPYCVVELPLEEYLQRYVGHETIGGINVATLK